MGAQLLGPLKYAEPAIGFDSVNISSIPAGCSWFGAYVDGRWPTATEPRAAQLQSEGSYMVTITTGTNLAARVIDCERGDADPGTAAAWCHDKIARGSRPTVYASTATWPQVVAELEHYGLNADQVDWWAADPEPEGHPPNQEHVVAGSVATQFGWPSLGDGTGGNYDVSVSDGYWPAYTKSHPPAPAPEPSPEPPETPEKVTLPLLRQGDTGGAVKSLQRLLAPHIRVADELGVFGPKTASAIEAVKYLLRIEPVNADVTPELWSVLIDNLDNA
jgi:hypothetical protein